MSGIYQTTDARRFASFSTNKCLDSNTAGHVYTMDCNGGDYQLWEWNIDQSIQNVATGNCLDSNGFTVYALPCNGGKYQKWHGSDHSGVINVATHHCLDSNEDGNVYPLNCNGGGYQNWHL